MHCVCMGIKKVAESKELKRLYAPNAGQLRSNFLSSSTWGKRSQAKQSRRARGWNCIHAKVQIVSGHININTCLCGQDGHAGNGGAARYETYKVSGATAVTNIRRSISKSDSNFGVCNAAEIHKCSKDVSAHSLHARCKCECGSNIHIIGREKTRVAVKTTRGVSCPRNTAGWAGYRTWVKTTVRIEVFTCNDGAASNYIFCPNGKVWVTCYCTRNGRSNCSAKNCESEKSGFQFVTPDLEKGTYRERTFTTDAGMNWEGNPNISSEQIETNS